MITGFALLDVEVSIPFKRESVFRVNRQDAIAILECIEFQFPSNGKVYSEAEKIAKEIGNIEFQFPSNGKVYSEQNKKGKGDGGGTSFNSLQTGKCIQRHYLTCKA